MIFPLIPQIMTSQDMCLLYRANVCLLLKYQTEVALKFNENGIDVFQSGNKLINRVNMKNGFAIEKNKTFD